MQQSSMTLNEFMNRFPDEKSCREHLFNTRWSDGFKCPRCGHDKYYEIEDRKLYQCASCGYQASVTAGTIFHKSHTPLKIWFWAIFFVAKDKRGVSAAQLSREFPVSYPTAWNMLHKIREAMGERDSYYLLSNIIKVDECYIGSSTKDKKRGRGTEKAKVLVSLSVTEDNRPLFAKLDVIEDLTTETIREKITANFAPGSKVSTDGYTSYSGLEEQDFVHDKNVLSDGLDIDDVFDSVHTLISNVKRFIIGTYHGLKDKHLQNYLDEYCYRFNRRFWHDQLFDRLLDACIVAKPTQNLVS